MKNKLFVLFSCFGISGIIWFSLSLSEYHEFYVEAKPILTDIPVGLATTDKLPEVVKIKFRANGWNLITFLVKKKQNFNIPLRKNSLSQRVELKKALKNNQWFLPEFELLQLAPEEIDINLDKRDSRSVPVASGISLTFKDGFGLAKPISITPPSVVLSGSFRVLSKIDTIVTKSLLLEDIAENQDINIELESGVLFASPNTVRVFVDVQQIVEKEFQNIPVEILDLPSDRNVLLLPDKVNVTLRGGINLLSDLDYSQIKVYIEYNDLVNSQSESITPRTFVPQYFEVVSVTPKFIKFIIKKF